MSIFAVFLLASITMVLGAVTINTPASGLAVNGTYVFNVTTDQNATLNCTYATTADGVFGITLNTSAEQKIFINSTSTATLTDALATTLTVTCTNSSDDEETATVSFDIDNTDPTCSFTVDLENIERQSGSGITISDASSDTTTLTYSYVLTDEGGTTIATYTSQNPTFSNGDLESLGENTITLTLTDEVSKTSTCSDTIFVTGSGTTSAVPILSTIQDLSQKNQIIGGIILLVILIIIIVASIFIFGMVKSKRR